METIENLRDTFREVADILDEFIAVKAKEDSGDDVSKECEIILGRFMMKMLELQALQSQM